MYWLHQLPLVVFPHHSHAVARGLCTVWWSNLWCIMQSNYSCHLIMVCVCLSVCMVCVCVCSNPTIMWHNVYKIILLNRIRGARKLADVERAWKELTKKGIEPDEQLIKAYATRKQELGVPRTSWQIELAFLWTIQSYQCRDNYLKI